MSVRSGDATNHRSSVASARNITSKTSRKPSGDTMQQMRFIEELWMALFSKRMR